MTDLGKFPVGRSSDNRLAERLSHLRPFVLPDSIDPGSEEKLLRKLRKGCLRNPWFKRFCQGRVGNYWAAVLISILFFLLGWDLFRIIRLLLI